MPTKGERRQVCPRLRNFGRYIASQQAFLPTTQGKTRFVTMQFVQAHCCSIILRVSLTPAKEVMAEPGAQHFYAHVTGENQNLGGT
jgi:hypothetical protein